MYIKIYSVMDNLHSAFSGWTNELLFIDDDLHHFNE